MTLEKDYYSIEQVAEMLQVHYNTVRRWILSGDIPAAKLCDTWRIKKSDLEMFFDVNRIKPAEPKTV